MTMNELIMKAREKKCSDIHISEGMPVSFRIHGQLLDSGFSFPAAETREMILSMLSDEQREQLENGDDVDFAIETPDYCRQRVNVFRQMKKGGGNYPTAEQHHPDAGTASDAEGAAKSGRPAQRSDPGDRTDGKR